jgi:hypothetical protein
MQRSAETKGQWTNRDTIDALPVWTAMEPVKVDPAPSVAEGFAGVATAAVGEVIGTERFAKPIR